jgi:hypothetical protein
MIFVVLSTGQYWILYAEQDADSINIVAATNESPPKMVTRLQNFSLPTTGCEPNFEQCHLTCFPCGHVGQPETLCCVLPVIDSNGTNGLAFLQLQRATIRLQNQTIATNSYDCVMGRTFDRLHGDRVVACFNTTTSDGLAYMLFGYLSYDDTNTLKFVVENPPPIALFNGFPDSLSLSETRFLQESNGDCPYVENLFFVSTSQAFIATIKDEDRFDIASAGDISDCLHPIDVAYIETATNRLLLRVQCSQHITKLVRVCGTHRTEEVYDSRVNGSVHQCVAPGAQVNVTLGADTISFKSTSDLPIFENISSSHPFELTPNISYGFCNIGSDLNLVFGLSNGSVLSFSFTTGKTSTLARNSCSSSTNSYSRGECYKARLTNSSGVVLVYDHVDSSFVVANLSCVEDPVVARVHIEPRPPLAELVEGLGGSCPSPPTPFSTAVLATVTSSITPTLSLSSESVSSSVALTVAPPVPKNTERSNLLGLIALALPLVALLGVVVLFAYRDYRKKRNLTLKQHRFNHSRNGNFSTSIHGSENGRESINTDETQMSFLGSVQPGTASPCSHGEPPKCNASGDSRLSLSHTEALDTSDGDTSYLSNLVSKEEEIPQPTLLKQDSSNVPPSPPSIFSSRNPGELATMEELVRPSQATASPRHVQDGAAATTSAELESTLTTGGGSSHPPCLSLGASSGASNMAPVGHHHQPPASLPLGAGPSSSTENASPSHQDQDPYVGALTTSAMQSSRPQNVAVVPGQLPYLPSPQQHQQPQQNQPQPRQGGGGSSPVDPMTGEQQSRRSLGH